MKDDLITREISEKVLKAVSEKPVVTIVGPRQSGKTTLCKMLFPKKEMVSLERIDERSFAAEDPVGFLNRFPDGVIIDEAQRVPELFSYIQTIVDDRDEKGLFVLTGSDQLGRSDKAAQSLAGRTRIIKLLPFSLNEAYGERLKNQTMESVIFTGFYPRIFKDNLDPAQEMNDYIETYVNRDVKRLANIENQREFDTFLRICAGRTGQELNLSSIQNDTGINRSRVKGWTSLLEASYIIKLVKPFENSYDKRQTKKPKLYFLDTGLACRLLGITEPGQIFVHPLRGALFETLVFNELLKKQMNTIAVQEELYYFRENKGLEIDFIYQKAPGALTQIEVKSGQTITSKFFQNLDTFAGLSQEVQDSVLVYGGEQKYVRQGIHVVGWKHLPGLDINQALDGGLSADDMVEEIKKDMGL
jgi:predicted AAA+ superfamily ATPase